MHLTEVTPALLAADHYAVVARLRAERPVAWAPAMDRWLISRHDLVQAVVADVDTFVSDHPRSLISGTFGPQMLSADGKEQRRHRAPYAAAFRPRQLRATVADAVVARAEAIVGAVGPGDDLTQPAAQMAVTTVLDVLGLTQVAAPGAVSSWYDDLAPALANVTGNPEVAERGRAAARAFGAALQEAAADGRLDPTGQDGLTAQERVSNTLLVLFGGIETTQSAILNALWALAVHQEAQAALRADRALVPRAVEESLRWEPSVLTLTRFTRRTTVLDGVTIPRDSVIECLIGGANRDPALFVQPDRFDVHRGNAAAHLTFGHGPHFCLGAHLARIEAVAMLEAVLDRAPAGFGFAHPDPPGPAGHEFRHPPELRLTW